MATAGMLVVMVLVFVGAYWASRILAQHYQGGGGRSGNIKILERTAVGQGSWLVLAQVGKQIHLLGVTAKEIRCLATFPQEDIATIEPKSMSPISFQEILHSFKQGGGSSNGSPKTDK